nr:MAG TPA: Glycine rich protein family [Caudoviricetes sp.]
MASKQIAFVFFLIMLIAFILSLVLGIRYLIKIWRK